MTDAKMRELVMESQIAGDKAGDEWMEKMTKRGPKYAVMNGDVECGRLLDLCGNAHVRARDGRSKIAKFLKRLDPNGNRYTVTVPKSRKYAMRQEYGLAQAIARAQMEYLMENGITGLTIWEYID